MDRKKLFPRMTRQELMLLLATQKGIRAVRETFIDMKKYSEPQSVKEKRLARFKRKKEYFKLKGIDRF